MDATKLRLLEAAGEEFAEKGFDVATIRSICRRANANVAAVNYHFADKEHLYVQAVIQAHRCSMPEVEHFADEGGPPADRLRNYVRDFLQRILAIDSRPTWHHRLMLRELLHPSEASDALVRESIRPNFETLLEILREVRPDAGQDQLNATAFSIVGQCLHYKMARPITERLIGREALAAMDLDFLTDHIAGFTLAALGLAPPIGSKATLAASGGRRGEA